MTTDPELHELLTESAPPSHRPGFWTDLRADLGAAEPGRHPHDEGLGLGPVSDDDGVVVALAARSRTEQPRGTRRPPRWLVAAAAACLVVVGVAVTRDGADRVGVVTDPDGPVASDPGPGVGDPGPGSARVIEPGARRPEGAPIERGLGAVVGVDRSSRFVYVAAPDAAGGFGCEGVSRRSIQVEPIGGGTRQPALPLEVVDATGGVDLSFGPDGRVAIRTTCEGYGGRIVVAHIAPDGTFTDPVEVTLPDPDGTGPVDALHDVEWRGSDELVAALALVRSGVEPMRLYSIPTDGRPATDLGFDGTTRLSVSADGRVATAHRDGTIRFDGDVIGTTADVLDLVVSPDGARVTVTHVRGLTVIATDGGDRSEITIEGTAYDLVSLPSGDVVALVSLDDGDRRLVWIDPTAPTDAPAELVGATSGLVGFAVSPDASRLLVTRTAATSEDEYGVVFLEQRLTR